MWNKRYEPMNSGGSSVTKEVEAIIESQRERERKQELRLKKDVKNLCDDKLYKSLKKILLKVTKAS